MVNLRAKLLHLNDTDIAWGEKSIASMSSEEKTARDEVYLKEPMEKSHLGG